MEAIRWAIMYLVTLVCFVLCAVFTIALPFILIATVLEWIHRGAGIALLVVAAVEIVVPILPRRPYFCSCFLSFWSWVALPGELHSAAEFREDRNYLVALYPHGLFGLLSFLPLLSAAMVENDIAPFSVTADVILWVPFLKRLASAMGCIGASKQEISWALQQSYPFNVTLITPGGIEEMFYGVGHEQIVLRKRKGFIKLALQHGSDLVPGYGFGINQQFYRLTQAHGCCAKFSVALQIAFVFWVDQICIPFGIIPSGHELRLVLGSPIKVEAIEDPTEAQVEGLHSRFCEAIRELFDAHKESMGWGDKFLYFEDEDPADDDTSDGLE